MNVTLSAEVTASVALADEITASVLSTVSAAPSIIAERVLLEIVEKLVGELIARAEAADAANEDDESEGLEVGMLRSCLVDLADRCPVDDRFED